MSCESDTLHVTVHFNRNTCKPAHLSSYLINQWCGNITMLFNIIFHIKHQNAVKCNSGTLIMPWKLVPDVLV